MNFTVTKDKELIADFDEKAGYCIVKDGYDVSITGKISLKDESTVDLIEELKNRRGVTVEVITPYEEYKCKVNGPCIVMKVID